MTMCQIASSSIPDTHDRHQVLLDHGAEIDTVTDTHFTPLHAASQSGHLMAVKVQIISHGALDRVCYLRFSCSMTPSSMP